MPPNSLLIALSGAALICACTLASSGSSDADQRGKMIYTQECAGCHGASAEGGGPVAASLGIVPPDLRGLRQRNDGYFPREFVRRFVLGLLEKDDPNSAMPDFAKVGLRHVYPQGGADGEVLEVDFSALLDYLEALQD